MPAEPETEKNSEIGHHRLHISGQSLPVDNEPRVYKLGAPRHDASRECHSVSPLFLLSTERLPEPRRSSEDAKDSYLLSLASTSHVQGHPLTLLYITKASSLTCCLTVMALEKTILYLHIRRRLWITLMRAAQFKFSPHWQTRIALTQLR